jgi:hypothetical protein
MFIYELKVLMGHHWILDPKRHPNILRKEESKETKDFTLKVKE